jgi:hypothetical protein
MLKLRVIKYSGDENETMPANTTDYVRVYKANYGIISQPLYFMNSK